MRIVSWFSCGTASAVTTKLVLAKYRDEHEVIVARCIVPEEHPDNDRFAADCVRWFNAPILTMRSDEYDSCEDVWTRTRYMAGIGGARCTVEMKKTVRFAFEREWRPDAQAFGYTVDEKRRIEHFREQNPEINLLTPLIDDGLDKEACHAIVNRAGIALPYMYIAGYDNANCIGCVQASSPRYWNRTRRLFPDEFARRAILSRELGARLVKVAEERIFLDELDPALDTEGADPKMECSLLCYLAEQAIRS